MRVQKMIDYLKVYYPDFLNNETIERMRLLTMLADMWGMGFDKGHNEGYEVGYVDGYEKGYQDRIDEEA